MRRAPARGLVPLRAAAGLGPDAAARAEARLRASWLLVVGPALVKHTCLVRASRGILVVGCWRPQIIPSLRISAEAAWPQVRERLRTLWKLEFRTLEVVPCDPPPEEKPAPPRREPDAFKAVLEILKAPKKG